MQQLAERHELKLLFDASHGMRVSTAGKMVGNFGHAEVFSFHATKFVNCFEGGAICTNDDAMAEKIRLMKNFGFSGLDSVIYLGTNGKMSEPSAAMGLTSLESMEEFVEHNRVNYRSYLKWISEVPGLKQVQFDEREKCNFQYIVIEVSEKEFGISRDRLMEILHRENIRARRYFYPGVHEMEPYRSYYPNARLLLPTTEALVRKTLCLPTGTSVSTHDIEQIGSLVMFLHERAEQVRAAEFLREN